MRAGRVIAEFTRGCGDFRRNHGIDIIVHIFFDEVASAIPGELSIG
jgi:hypothetical protein